MTPQERNTRILSLLSYLGLAPFFWFFSSLYRGNGLFKHHLYYSLALSFANLCVLVIQILVGVIFIELFGFGLLSPSQTLTGSSQSIRITFQLFNGGLLIIGIVLSIVWCICLQDALLGRARRLPVISQIASVKWALDLAVYSSFLGYFASLVLIGIGVDSSEIANAKHETADVYVLYTVGGYIPAQGLYETYTPPNWAVTMAFYPLVRAGMEKFGDDRVSVLPLSEATFNEAIHSGRFIFIASHGGVTPGTFAVSTSPLKEYGPSNVPRGYVGNQLQFVYFAGCDAGRLESDWRRALGVEDAIMFDRISYVGEHLLWVWSESPGVIAGLK